MTRSQAPRPAPGGAIALIGEAGEAELLVAKRRNGRSGLTITLTFQKEFVRWPITWISSSPVGAAGGVLHIGGLR